MLNSRHARLLPLAVFLLAPAAGAQSFDSVVDLHEPCVLRVDDPGPPVAEASLARLPTHTVVTRRAAVFEVTYTGFTAEAEAAFQRAVDIWADHLESEVLIRVNAQFGPLGSGVLGSAGPLSAYSNRPEFPVPNTLYPDALADALAGASQSGANADIRATFNSNFGSFYFGLDGNPPSNRYDFTTVVLHELGHGLGFVGSARFDDGQGAAECNGQGASGCWGFNGVPIIYDRFVEDTNGDSFLDEVLYPNPSTELGSLLRSNNLFFDGVTLTATQNDVAPKIQAPTTFQAGSSYSHFNENTFTGSSDALMTPFINPGEAYGDVGVTTCALFADLGWQLAGGCLTLVADEPLAAAASPLRLTSANPAPGAARLSLSLATPGPVRADLFDVLGRRVATLHAGDASAGELRLRTPADLVPGRYLVRVAADGAVWTAPVTRL